MHSFRRILILCFLVSIMAEKIIQQGAEAVIVLKNNRILKRRIKKSYRLNELDESLRKRRTRSEARILEKTEKLISVPRVLKVDDREKVIEMEFISGLKLSEKLDSMKNWKEVCFEIGKSIGKLHEENVIHGDLTTSNMIWQEKEKKLYFIDFGLSYGNGRVEDKAVDLHLIKQALEAKHFLHWEKYWEEILEGYKSYSEFGKVLERLKEVEKRGRYKKAG